MQPIPLGHRPGDQRGRGPLRRGSRDQEVPGVSLPTFSTRESRPGRGAERPLVGAGAKSDDLLPGGKAPQKSPGRPAHPSAEREKIGGARRGQRPLANQSGSITSVAKTPGSFLRLMKPPYFSTVLLIRFKPWPWLPRLVVMYSSSSLRTTSPVALVTEM